MAVPTQAVILS